MITAEGVLETITKKVSRQLDKIAGKSKERVMVGASKYDLPSVKTLADTVSTAHKVRQQQVLEEMAARHGMNVGELSVEHYHKKIDRRAKLAVDPVSEYANNFSNAADYISSSGSAMHKFAEIIKARVL